MRLLVLLSLLLPSLAQASDVATTAAEVWQEHCADTQSAGGKKAGASFAAVGTAFSQVSDALETAPAPELLYWRGLLGGCLGRADLADEDLSAFLLRVGDDPVYATQAEDARRRLARAMSSTPTVKTGPDPAGLILGAGMAAGSAVLFAGSGAAYDELQGHYTFVYGGNVRRDAFDSEEVIGDEIATRTNVLLISGGVAAAASLAAFVVTSARANAPRVAALIAPLPDGVALSLAGRW
mgnify:CR=1 FL=1